MPSYKGESLSNLEKHLKSLQLGIKFIEEDIESAENRAKTQREVLQTYNKALKEVEKELELLKGNGSNTMR